jgi:hypothetical protein
MRTPMAGELPPATLYYKVGDEWVLVQRTEVKEDSNGRYYQFLTNTAPQTAWKVEWPTQTKMEIEDITVSGILTLYSKPSTERARAQLAIYPTNLVPKDETLCRLAFINVNIFELQRNARGELLKEDIRNIATRDYEPVADWLTEYWDEQLIRNQEKVAAYTPGFMEPPTLLKTSYFDLEAYGVDISDEPPPHPPSPPKPTEVNLINASVSLFPVLPTQSQLIGAEVSFLPQPPAPAITDITVNVINP